MIAFEVSLTSKDVRPLVARVGWRLYVFLFVVAFTPMAAVRLTQPATNDSDMATTLLWYALGIAIGGAIVVPLLVTLLSFRLARAAGGLTRYTVTENGIDVDAQDVRTHFGWPAFRGWVAAATVLLLRLRLPGKVLVFPRRCLSDSQWAELEVLLASKVPKLARRAPRERTAI